VEGKGTIPTTMDWIKKKEKKLYRIRRKNGRKNQKERPETKVRYATPNKTFLARRQSSTGRKPPLWPKTCWGILSNHVPEREQETRERLRVKDRLWPTGGEDSTEQRGKNTKRKGNSFDTLSLPLAGSSYSGTRTSIKAASVHKSLRKSKLRGRRKLTV